MFVEELRVDGGVGHEDTGLVSLQARCNGSTTYKTITEKTTVRRPHARKMICEIVSTCLEHGDFGVFYLIRMKSPGIYMANPISE